MSKLIYEGKTKDVYDNQDGTYTLKLKDDATGKDGVFDPGENAVGLRIEGFGRESLELSKYYFEKLREAGIPTHYVDSNIKNATMTVKPVTLFGQGVEFVCRCKADGSFLRRYGAYATFGTDLDHLVEITLKDDERQDPLITDDALIRLDIMAPMEIITCRNLTIQATKVIKEDLLKKDLELYDIKFEFGLHNGEVMLIDEISEGCMRVYKDGVKVPPLKLKKFIL
jgi:phosphoribosylaminoimidazole-succinocarboxamide synthase